MSGNALARVVVCAIAVSAAVAGASAAPAARPHVVSVEPSKGATGVARTTSVILTLSEAVNRSTVGAATVQVTDPSGTQVPGTYNSDAAGALVTFTPSQPLAPSTRHQVRTTPGLLTRAGCGSGCAFAPFRSAFTTGTAGGGGGDLFRRVGTIPVTGPTVVTYGPDGALWYARNDGVIVRQPVDATTGAPSGQPTTYNAVAGSLVLGMSFRPGTSQLWVSRNVAGYAHVPNFTGRVAVLHGPSYARAQDRIVGLPRSARDHATNAVVFGPDGKLYISQGSLSGYGAPDPFWDNRPETLLSGAILRFDPNTPGVLDASPSAGYDPRRPGAPLQLYAIGVRNIYDLVFHSNGSLYGAGNESASGNAPAGPGANPPALNNLPAYHDYLARIVPNGYYGHPNPALGHYVVNGGNPTAAIDPFEVTEYPVGIQPEPDWVRPIRDLGKHRSPDGSVEYTSGACPRLVHDLLIAEFSAGDDIIAVKLDAAGGYRSQTTVRSGLTNPLDVATNAHGHLVVAEYGSQPRGTGGQVSFFVPAC